MKKTIRGKWLLLGSSAVLFFCIVSFPALAHRDGPETQGGPETRPYGPRFIDDQGNPLALARIRILCYTGETAAAPVGELLVTTGSDGRPGTPLPPGCTWIAALRQLLTQDSGKASHGPAFTIYTTSWTPGSRELHSTSGDVVINPKRRLVLFRLTASLDRSLPLDRSYLAEVRIGLFKASRYLYDLSDGQAAIGELSIFTGGQAWQSADLRFLAANDYRPTAFVGGIVPKPIPYTTPAGKNTIFAPGAVYLGRYWDGQDAFNPLTGSWAQANAYRTLGHEWGHYALFLFDEYQMLQDTDKDEQVEQRTQTYCTCDTLFDDLHPCASNASVMSYQYHASELWHPSHGLPFSCTGAAPPSTALGTEQWYVHGEPDWMTLGRWDEIQGLSAGFSIPPALLDGPALGLAGDLFNQQVRWRLYLPALSSRGSNLTGAEDLTIGLRLEDGPADQRSLDTLYPQVYLVQQASSTPPGGIIYQGTTHGGRDLAAASLNAITLLGVYAGDQLRAYADRYNSGGSPGGRYVYPPPDSPEAPLVDGMEVKLAPAAWTPSLDIRYTMTGSQVIRMSLLLDSPQELATPPTAQICSPDAALRCPSERTWRTTMTQSGATTWNAAFTAADGVALPDYALVMISTPRLGDFIRSFQTAGGVGPAHMLGDAPLRDGSVTVDASGKLSGEHNQVILMGAADYHALQAPLPKNVDGVQGRVIGGILGQPIDLDILLPAKPAEAELLDGREPQTVLPAPVILTLFYSQEIVNRLQVDEALLRLLYFNRSTNAWVVVPASGVSKASNWLASTPRLQDGIYAIGWIKP